MRHRKSGDRLGVLPDHRRALLRNMTLSLIEHEEIKTTPRRAKAIRWFADHLVTLAKKGDVASRRRIVQLLGSTETGTPGQNRIRNAVGKLYSDYAPRFQTRNGGFTQIFRLADRRAGDGAEMCIFRYIPNESTDKKSAGKTTKKASSEKAPKKVAKAASDKAEKAPKKEAVEDKPAKKESKKKDK